MSSAISCSAWRLYVIVDGAACADRDLAWIAEQAIRGGANVIQLRHKSVATAELVREAQRLLAVTRPAGVPLIINDRPDVAAAVGAEGVHLGQHDLTVDAARAILGPDRLIGQSTHSLEQSLAADRQPVDYVALGPIFATPTKPDYGHVGPALIAVVKPRLIHPLVVIGGIEEATIEQVARAGATCVAVVRAVCAAPDPAESARRLKRALLEWSRTGKAGSRSRLR